MRTISPMNLASATMMDFQKAYRAIMTAEEVLALAGNDCLDGGNEYSPAANYVFSLQEMLSEERGDLINRLREKTMADPIDEIRRVALLVEYEAWCGEFTKETLALLATSNLSATAN